MKYGRYTNLRFNQAILKNQLGVRCELITL